MIRSNTSIDFRVDIIRDHIKVGEIHPESCSVNYRESAEVMHTMKMRVYSWQFQVGSRLERVLTGLIYFNGTRKFDGSWTFSDANGRLIKKPIVYDMFSDRLRPIIIVDGKEYDYGDFVVIAAPQSNDGVAEYYDIEAYDETMILKQAATVRRLYYQAGTSYLSIVGSLVAECGLSNIVMDKSELVISADREWKFGTTYLSIINTLLSEIGYAPIHAGSHGSIYVMRDSSGQTANYYYTDKNSKIIGGIVRDTDIYSLPNVVVGYVSNPDIANSLISVRQNDNPDSKISTVRRGYKVVQSKQLNDCPDQGTLDLVVNNLFLSASQATESVKLSTLPDGYHDYGGYMSVDVGGESHLYREVEWDMDFGGKMSHKLERKVIV